MHKAIIREATDFSVTDPKVPVKLLVDTSYDSIPPTTIIETFRQTVEESPDRIAFVWKDEVIKELKMMTFKEYKVEVEKMAKVFIKLGLERHGTVAVFSYNCVEWIISELAAIHAGGIITGIYTTSSVEACFHILQSSRANIVVVDSDEHMEIILQIKHKLPHCKAVIKLHSRENRKSKDYWRWSELKVMKTDDVEDDYQERLRNVAVNECCCLIYTSGTVGNPKGAMLSHDNIMFDVKSAVNHFGNLGIGKEVIVSYLPMSHAAAQMCDVMISLYIGATVYFADKAALKSSLLETLKNAQPTLFLGVPRVFEKIQEKMMAIGAEANLIKRFIGDWAKRVTFEHHINQSNSIQFKIAQHLVLNRVKQALGLGRCKLFLTGAAPTNATTKKYFLSLDMPMTEAYGMTESSSVHSIAELTIKNRAKSLPGMETKLVNLNNDEHGEICVRGRHVFMGYINEPEKTADVIDEERWMRTGDLGYIDSEGYLHVTGRIKEILITSGGENIPFLSIENCVKSECAAISNAFVVGDRRKFLTLLITLKTCLDENGSPCDALESETISWLKTIGLNFTKLSEVHSSGPHAKILSELQDAVDRANEKALSKAQRVQKFSILPTDFSVTNGELTPTMKVKRSFVIHKYQDLIESFYAD